MIAELQTASAIAAYAVVVVIPFLAFAARGEMIRAARPVARSTWFALGGILLVWACCSLTLIPTGAWEPNHHGLQRWASFRHHSWFNDNFGEQQHGFTWHATLRLLLWCSGGFVSPPAASLLVLTLGLIALFFGLRTWVAHRRDADLIALAGVAGVLIQPLWLRLAPTGTVLAFSVAGQWATATAALWAARDPRPTTVALCTALAVWTMQTHLEQLAVVPALVAAVVVASRAAPWRAYLRLENLAILAFGAIALTPHLLLAAQNDPLAMARRPPTAIAYKPEVAWALRTFLVALAFALLSSVQRPRDASSPHPMRTRTGQIAAAVTAAAAWFAHAGPAMTLASGGETWSEARMNRLTALADPSWGPPWLLGAAAVGAWAGIRRPALTVFGPIAALGLYIYADKFDNFSTWLRGALPLIAWLGPLGGIGVYVWGRAAHPRWGPPAAFALTLALLSPWVAPITEPIDSQQEHDLLRAASAAQQRGEEVHALTTLDRGSVPSPERFEWGYHRSHIDAWLTSDERTLPPSLSDLLALTDEDARGRLVLLGPECFRMVTTTPAQVSSLTLTAVFGDRAFSGISLLAPIDQATDPRRRPHLAAWIPCAADPAAQQCAELGEDGVCATWVCAKGVTVPAPESGSQPTCDAVRRRFSLAPQVEMDLAAWSLNGSPTDTLTDQARIGLYRVTGPR